MSARIWTALAVCLLGVPSIARAQAPNDDIASLRASIAEERDRIAALQAELDRRTAGMTDILRRLSALEAGEPTAAPASTPSPAPPERLAFYGEAITRFDLLRHTVDGCGDCSARVRGRIRLRLGAEGQIATGVRALVGLSTGELNDPNSTYQTFGSKFARKVATWERGYVSIRPPRTPWMDVAIGKFPYTWLRSSMTFDVDLFPEGLSERFPLDLANAGPLKNVTLQGLQLVINEQGAGPDSLIIGGQATARLRIAPAVTTTAALTVLDFKRPETMLRAQLAASDLGVPNTNTVTSIGGQFFYATGFRYENLIVENAISTPWAALPVTAAVEVHRNLRAGAANGAASLRLDAGRLQHPGDWGFSYHLFHVEQDAIVSALGESDWRAPSNVLQQRIAVNRLIQRNVQAAFTWYRGRTLDPRRPGASLLPGISPGAREPWRNRMYFDLIYRY